MKKLVIFIFIFLYTNLSASEKSDYLRNQVANNTEIGQQVVSTLAAQGWEQGSTYTQNGIQYSIFKKNQLVGDCGTSCGDNFVTATGAGTSAGEAQSECFTNFQDEKAQNPNLPPYRASYLELVTLGGNNGDGTFNYTYYPTTASGQHINANPTSGVVSCTFTQSEQTLSDQELDDLVDIDPPITTCQEDFPNHVNIKGTMNFPSTLNNSGLRTMHTCFVDSKGALCGFDVPDSELYTTQGRNGSKTMALVHKTNGRNGDRSSISGNSTGQECPNAITESNPWAYQYPTLIDETEQATPPLVKNGNIVTKQLADGTKVDILLPSSEFNTDGSCPTGNDANCLTIIEANDDGKDYIVVTATDPIPETAYIDTFEVLQADANVDQTLQDAPQPQQVHLYESPDDPSFPPIKNQADNASDVKTTDSSHTTLTAYVGADGSNGNGSGSGSGSGGDGSGSGSGSGGDGTTEITLECGVGSTGLNCESTQAQINQGINGNQPDIQKGTFDDAIAELDQKEIAEREKLEANFAQIKESALNYLNPVNISGSGAIPEFEISFKDTVTIIKPHPDIIPYMQGIIMMIAYFFAFVILLKD